MLQYLIIFFIGFAFSFVGSIPPGVINISVLQHSVSGHFRAALRFALAAALIEYPYAYIAVRFESWISASPYMVSKFHLMATVVMLVLGILNLWSSKSPSPKLEKLNASGFRKGVLISLLNPLAIPFWIGITAYVRTLGWIPEMSLTQVAIYVSGISLGTFALLLLIALLGKKIAFLFRRKTLLNSLPGFVFLFLGLYSLFLYFS